MIRLHLTTQDLGRTVVRSTPAVMVEVVAAARLMRGPVPPRLAQWRARARASLRPVMRPLLDLVGDPVWAPDFLTPPSAGSRFDTALAQVLATPPAQLKAELAAAVAAGRLPARAGDLAGGDPGALHRLGAAITAFHAVAVEPYWAEAMSMAHADRATRGHMLMEAGIDQVLRTLSPFLRWEADVLSFDCGMSLDLSIRPAGRGITLIPSYFTPHPAVVDSCGAPIVVAYPISLPDREPRPAQPLTDLLGRTRAEVLYAIVPGRSTTQVAEHVGISPGSASQHASVLRSAGLVSTRRVGQAVLHALTPLGRRLMDLNR